MTTTAEQKKIPLAEHMRLPLIHEPAKFNTKKWRAVCTCGWRGRPSNSMDEAGGQFATHTSRVWEAQRAPIDSPVNAAP